MTWIVGAKCVDGLVCIGDVQVTIQHRDGTRQYFDCLQKVHKIYDNAICGFSGDVRVGLEMIRDMQIELEAGLRPNNHIFDLDGELEIFRKAMARSYSHHSKRKSESVELMILWSAPENEDGTGVYQYYCWSFRSPDFKQRGTGAVQRAMQSGSGSTDSGYKPIITFLDGKRGLGDAYREVLDLPENAEFNVTARKYRTMVMDAASQVHCPGVSQFFHGFEAIVDTSQMHDPEIMEKVSELFTKAGIKKQTPDGGSAIRLNPQDLPLWFPKLDNKTRVELAYWIKKAHETMDVSAYFKPLEFEFFTNIDSPDQLDSGILFSKWESLAEFLDSEGVNVKGVQAVA